MHLESYRQMRGALIIESGSHQLYGYRNGLNPQLRGIRAVVIKGSAKATITGPIDVLAIEDAQVHAARGPRIHAFERARVFPHDPTVTVIDHRPHASA